MKKSRILYIIFLIIGSAGQILPALLSLPAGKALLTLVWIYAFWELVCRYHTKKELIITGAVFVIGYSLKFAGATGQLWLDIILFSIFGLALYAIFCVSAYFMRRWDNFAGTLVFPAVWTLAYLIATVLRLPTLVRIDMMFTDMNILIQAERLIGSFGFSFVLIWIVSLLRFAVFHGKVWCAAVGLGLFLTMLVPGIVYMYPNISATETVRVAYTTGPYGGDFIDYSAPDYEACEESMSRSVRDAASQQAEILVFNEEAFEIDDSDEERLIRKCADLAAENRIAVLLGLDVRDTDGSEGGKSLDKIVMIGPDGEVLNSYLKSRLIPVLEGDYVSGDGKIPSARLELNGKSIRIAYVICYESNFPAYIKKIDPDTDLLLLPSWDWSSITELHSTLCRTIAVENDLYILKATYDGISAAINPDGEYIYVSSTDETGFERIHTVDIPVKSGVVTEEEKSDQSAFVYAIIGTDIFSMLVCIALIAGTLTFNDKKSRRAILFTVLLVTNIVACGADALSWLLDGHTRLNAAVYLSTLLSMLLTIILIWEFTEYLFEYVRERTEVSSLWLILSHFIAGAACIATVIMSINGDLFSVKDAVYYDGPKYGIYVVINIGMLVYAVAATTAFRKSLTVTDRVAAYAYAVIPAASAAINLFVEDWSFAYPASALSLLLIYVMIQSDEMDRLEHEGKIVSYHVTHDELTGLLNRRAYENRRERLKETDGTCGVIFGDLNGLKFANDHYGHAAGDNLLIQFAGLLTGIFRQNEIFRISGDEFVCIMENIGEDVFMQRLGELSETLARDEQPLASIGAVFGDNRNIDSLIKEAESRMYVEKDAFHERFPNTKR